MRRRPFRFALAISVTLWLAHVAPAEARFLQTDPVGYKDDLNPYAYVRNDPLNLSDPTGREVRLTGKDENRAEFIRVAERATGLPLSESKGTLVAGENASASGPAGQQVLDVIGSQNTIFVNAVSNEPGVLVDSFASGDVDVADIAGMQDHDAKLGAATLVHVISERSFAAANGTGYEPAHAQALADESAVMGAASRTSGGKYGPGGELNIEYRDASGEVVSSFQLEFDEHRTPH